MTTIRTTTGRLPDFLIIGAAKSATTSLARWLGEHPGAWIPYAKELRFFDRDDRWPEAADSYASAFSEAPPDRIVGEATPSYLASVTAAARIASMVPDAKLIASLRNPVDRAYAHYWHARDWGGESRDWDDIVTAALRGADEPYIRNGDYAAQIDRYDRHFPEAAICIVLFDDLVAAPDRVFGTVCRSLGLPEVRPANVGRIYNAHSRLRSRALREWMVRHRMWRRSSWLGERLERFNVTPAGYPEMRPDTRSRLVEHYAPGVQALSKRLGRDLGSWLQ